MTNLGKMFLILCLLAFGGGVVANAQIAPNAVIQANVPFAFAVSNTTLPAGNYEIRRLDDNAPNVLVIRSANGHTSVVFETEGAQLPADQAARTTELAFDKVGDRYFLSQVWVAGDSSGSELPKSRMEKRLVDGGRQSQRHSIVAVLKRMKP